MNNGAAQVGSHGYECVDGLDASLGMLGQVTKHNYLFILIFILKVYSILVSGEEANNLPGLYCGHG